MTAATAPASCTPRGTQTSPDVFKAPSMSTTPAMSLDGHKKFVGSPYKNKVSRQGLERRLPPVQTTASGQGEKKQRYLNYISIVLPSRSVLVVIMIMVWCTELVFLIVKLNEKQKQTWVTLLLYATLCSLIFLMDDFCFFPLY